MKKRHDFQAALLLISLAFAATPPAGAAETGLDPGRLLDHVKYLASDDLEGRGTGFPGAEKAAGYIEAAFQEAGLDFLPGTPDFRQTYETVVAVNLGPGNHLVLPGTEGNLELVVNRDYIPFAFSASGAATGPVLFAGYGITAPELGYDDYSGVDAKGKIVLVFRHEPRENDETSVFDGRKHSRHSDFRVKAKNAADHGALAILIVEDPRNHEPKDEALVPFGNGVAAEGAVSIPAVQIRREFAERLWGAGREGRLMSLEEVQAGIDENMKPNSFEASALPVSVTTDIVADSRPTVNVVGYLPPAPVSAAATSRPASPGEYIIIGAHYDHLGFGGMSSLAPDSHDIHNGADDNASGTSALLELARVLAADPAPRRRGIVFAAFSGEEIGLRGSAWFTAHPPLPLEQAVAMINMDMIGRLREEKLTIGGVGTSPLFRPLLERLLAEKALKPDFSESGYGPSDHNSFYAKNIPVLFFFTGAHEDYHRPTDDWNRVNVEGMTEVAGLVLDVARDLVHSGEAVPFARAAEDTTTKLYGAGSGSGAWLGIIPGYGEDAHGVQLTGVREKGPAETGGIMAGDLIVGYAGREVMNIYDLQDGLDRSRPGDVVEIVVLRGGERKSLMVTLGRRK